MPVHPDLTAKKRCPKCESDKYQFRSRKTIAAKDGDAASLETKYKCNACGHEWKLRVPA